SMPIGQPYPGFSTPGFTMGVAPSAPRSLFQRLKVWQWILLGVGAVFLTCCAGSVFISALSAANSSGAGAKPSQGSSASNAQFAPAGSMDLGHDFGQNTQGFNIKDQTDKFISAGEFAFVVNLSSGLGTTQTQLLLV